jgi:RNA polymerase sigma-70 factor (ECF subfamily)
VTAPSGSLAAIRRRRGDRVIDREADARAWIGALQAKGTEREEAASRLHALLVRAARFELSRRRAMLEASTRETIEDLAAQCADDALTAILAKLDDFRFESRFLTWAYKFAILEAAVRARRRAWQHRELPVDPEAWAVLPAATLDPAADLDVRQRLRAILAAIQTELSPHQREVLSALVLAEVPIDVLAERLGTTRGALYKTLHDARRKLRVAIGEAHD